MPKTLITGGAGFIGLHLAHALLRRGHQLTLVDNFAGGKDDAALQALIGEPAVQLLGRDLLGRESLDDLGADYDTIVHLAALLGVRNVREHPFETLWGNAAMFDPVIRLARRQRRLGRLLFASTSEAYDGTQHYFGMPVPTPECTPLTVCDLAEPRSTYMLSKIFGEAQCRYAGPPFTIIRVHNAYGPRMGLSHVIPELLHRAYHLAPGAGLEVYSVNHSRTFCYVSDLVEMVARVIENANCCGEVLNVGRQSPETAIGTLARIVLDTVGRDANIVPMTETAGSTPRRAPDMSKTLALVGYSATVELAEGVRRTFEWYRENVFAK